MVNIKVYMLNIEEISFERLLEYKKRVSLERRNKVERLHHMNDKKRCIITEILIQYLIRKETEKVIDDIKICYTSLGKPYIEGVNKKFNISHSGSWVVCALSDVPVGVDIEYIDESITSMKNLILSKEEYKRYEKSQNKDEFLYRTWTQKESYVKYLGVGLNMPFPEIEIYENKTKYSERSNKCEIVSQCIQGEYVLSVCCNEINDVEIIYVDCKEFEM